MSYGLLILLVLHLVTVNINGQNLITEDELNYGRWIEKYAVDGIEYNSSGMYRVFPVDNFNISDAISETQLSGQYRVDSNNSQQLLTIFQGRNGNVSVKDSIWRTCMEGDKLIYTEHWKKGIKQWTRRGNNIEGRLTYFFYSNHKRWLKDQNSMIDQGIEGNSVGNLVCSNEYVDVFYPDDFYFKNEFLPQFLGKFEKDEVNNYRISLTSSISLIIESIEATHNNLEIKNSSDILPFLLTAGDTVTFDVSFNLEPLTYSRVDTISITTSEEINVNYKLVYEMAAYHIDYDNVEVLKELSLSKSMDKFLIVSNLGTITEAIITSSMGSTYVYDVRDYPRIDLSNFEVGTYELFIRSSDIGGFIKLIVVE